ncbi:hypothetical protein ACLBOM_37650 [Escherichia coli]
MVEGRLHQKGVFNHTEQRDTAGGHHIPCSRQYGSGQSGEGTEAKQKSGYHSAKHQVILEMLMI